LPTPILFVNGVGPATAEKLAAAGFTAAEDLAVATPEQLAALDGFATARAQQVIADAISLVGETAPVVPDDQRPPTTAAPVNSKKPKSDKVKKKKGKKSKKSVEKKTESKKVKKDKKKKKKQKEARPDKTKKDRGKKKNKKKK
jgi:outer membrane biosynthesis protein TonB